MNLKIFTLVVILLAINSSSQQGQNSTARANSSRLECDAKLLTSYLLEGINVTTSDKNYLCNGIQHNCCTLNSQVKIYKMFRNGAQPTILNFYKRQISVYMRIFQLFKRVEDYAKNIVNETPIGESTNCAQLSNSVLSIKASEKSTQVIGSLQKAFRFLYDSRRGFYCMLCDAEVEDDLEPDEGNLSYSYGYCQKIVTETMNASLFKFEYFTKISRLYAQLLLSCSPGGVYEPNLNLPRSITFFKAPRISASIKKCVDGKTARNPIFECESYCTRFNPAKFSITFEGRMRRSIRYHKWMLGKFNEIQSLQTGASNKDDLNFLGRILQGTTPAANTPTTNVPAVSVLAPVSTAVRTNSARSRRQGLGSIINQFNVEQKTMLINPITVMPTVDLFTAVTKRRYWRSIFPMEEYAPHNIANLYIDIEIEGANLLEFGYQSHIDDASMDLLMNAINPNYRLKAANGTASNETAKPVTPPPAAGTPAPKRRKLYG